VVAAYVVAHELAKSRPPTNASVGKRLEAVIEDARRIEAAEGKIARVLRQATATNASVLLKKAAHRFGVGHLIPADGELAVHERIAKRAARARPQVRPLPKDVPTRYPGACRRDGSSEDQHQAVSLEVPRLQPIGTSLSRSDAPGTTDGAAAVAASRAMANGLRSPMAPTNPSVAGLLKTVAREVRKIKVAQRNIDRVFEDSAVPHARMLLEEQALGIAVRHLIPVDRNLPTLTRFAKQVDRARMLVYPVSKGMFVRHARGNLDRHRGSSLGPPSLAAGVRAACRHGMSAELEKMVTETAERISDTLRHQSMNTHLIDAARGALASLRQYSELYACIVPPENLVVALGALELFCAWQPGQRPTTSVDTSVDRLIGHLRAAARPDVDGWDPPREALLAVIGAWKAGRAALLFDGHDFSRQKRCDFLHSFQLDTNYSV
ncbi:MAG: hypothetical protein ABSC06_33230, partial [Rhodopila sp.]|jgi:hypothetical protein